MEHQNRQTIQPFTAHLQRRAIPLFVAHRGLSGEYTENTMEAFKQAFTVGAECIECDMQLSSDAVPVILHDETVDRTTKATGLLKDFTSMELESLNVPTLSQVLSLLHTHRNHYVNIEIKIAPNKQHFIPFLESLIAVLEKYCEFHAQILLSSFHYGIMKFCKELRDERFPELSLGTLRQDDDTRPWNHILQETGSDIMITSMEQVLSWENVIPTDNMTPLGIYTINSQEEWSNVQQRLIGQKFSPSNSFIFTDDVRVF
jgi:glycerophosphoryl diester phosphodiesterase